MARLLDERETTGDPERARKAADRSPADVLTSDAGPLPVWGWAAVAVAAVLIYRKLIAPPPAKAPVTGTTIPQYPTDTSEGGVYFLPSFTNGSSTPPPGTTPSNVVGWGPNWPEQAPGVVPDRGCGGGRIAISDYVRGTWSCATFDQLAAMVGGVKAAAAAGTLNVPNVTPPQPNDPRNCPQGSTLTTLAGGLACVGSAGTPPAPAPAPAAVGAFQDYVTRGSPEYQYRTALGWSDADALRGYVA